MQETLEYVLRECTQLIQCSRAYIFELDHVKNTMSNTFEWINPAELWSETNPAGINTEMDNLQNLPQEIFPDWMEKLENNKIIIVENVDEYGFIDATREILKKQKIKSLLAVSLFWDDRLQGFLGVDECKINREWDSLTIDFLKDQANNISYYLRRKKAEERIRFLSSITENTSDSIIVADTSFNITYINKAAEKLFGYTLDELKGKTADLLNAEPKAEKIQQEIYRTIVSGNTYLGESLNKRKDGSVFYCEYKVFPVSNDHGDIFCYIGIQRDVTERKNIEEKERIQQQQLMQASKMASLGILVSGIAHEINNPNTFIMLNTPILENIFNDIWPVMDKYFKNKPDILIGGQEYKKVKKNIPLLFKGIMNGSKRIKNIVEELRHYARRDSSLMSDHVDINRIINSALSLLANMIKKSTDHFSIQYEKDMPLIKAHSQRIEQVIINILENACQALPDKTKRIHVATKYNSVTGKITITVKDEGVGIARESIEHITDPFFTTKREIGGTGLGLSISESIIKDHGGAIAFYSELHKGTTVEVTIPVSA